MANLVFNYDVEDIPWIDFDATTNPSTVQATLVLAQLRIIHDVLCDFLQPDSSRVVHDVVDQLTPYYNDKWFPDGPNFYAIIDDLAAQIPCQHPAHVKLVHFVKAFAENPKCTIAPIKIQANRTWPVFYQGFKEYLVDHDSGPDWYAEDGKDPVMYVNRMAFAATMLREGIPYEQSCHLIWSMSQLLQQDRSQDSQNVRECWVLGAAQWILLSAAQVFAYVLNPDDAAVKSERKKFHFWQKKKRDRALEKKWPIRLQQWRSWKGNFESLALDETYSPACRNAAAQAADLMALQDKERSMA